jgi:hypothetical protein
MAESDSPCPGIIGYAHASVYDHAGPSGRSRYRAQSVLPSVSGTTSAPGKRVLSRLNGWPVRSPANASLMPSRATAHDFGVDAVRYTSIMMDLHHLLLSGLPAHFRITLHSHRQRGHAGAVGQCHERPLTARGQVTFISEIARSTTVLHQPFIEPNDVKVRFAGQRAAAVLNCAVVPCRG